MNWQNVKEFLKPNWRKFFVSIILFFIILLITTPIIIFEPFYFLAFLFELFIGLFVAFPVSLLFWIYFFLLPYILSCLIFWIYNKVKKR